MRFNNKGVTLIELLIALSILGIVITVAFSFFLFGAKTYAAGNSQSSIQFDVRMASKFITDELRNAVSIELIDSPTTFENNFYYIFIQGSTIKSRYNGVESAKTTVSIEELFPMFKINKLANGNNTLEFQIKGSKDTPFGIKNYQIESKVNLNNVKGLSLNQNQAIKYQKP